MYEPELFQLTYVSRITALGLAQISVLSDISIVSTKNNLKNNITGVLYYGHGYFFEYVEGSEKALTNLKNELLMDGRHDEISILDFSQISERRFDKWVMWSSIIDKSLTSNERAYTLNKVKFYPERWKEGDWRKFSDKLYDYYKQHRSLSEPTSMQLPPAKKRITFYRVLRENKRFINIQALFLIGLTLLIVFIICNKI